MGVTLAEVNCGSSRSGSAPDADFDDANGTQENGREMPSRSKHSSRRGDRDRSAANMRPKAGSQRLETVLLYGLHAVEAALQNPARQVYTLHLTPNAEQRIGRGGAMQGA